MTNEEKLQKDPLITLLVENKINSTLTGGCIIDILEDRKPKDYDFRYISDMDLQKVGATYMYETKTAKTFKTKKFVIQVLKTLKEDFDFKISTVELKISFNYPVAITIDDVSFNNKMLIPQEKSFIEKKNALNSLRRIPHWRRKGYNIADETYMSLLNVVGKSSSNNS